MTKHEKLRHCAGCRNNLYNGNNNLGVEECWMLKDAKLILRKEVHIDQHPPWNQKAQKFLSCYQRQRYIYVGKDVKC